MKSTLCACLGALLALCLGAQPAAAKNPPRAAKSAASGGCQKMAEKFAIAEAKMANRGRRAKFEVRNVIKASLIDPSVAQKSKEPVESYSIEVWQDGQSFTLYDVTMKKRGCRKLVIKSIESI